MEPEGWRNPIRKVKPPKVPELILEPVELETVRKMIEACGGDAFGMRDMAVLRASLDTGTRAQELIALNLEDADLITGEIVVKHGKGGKVRTVFVGQKESTQGAAVLPAAGADGLAGAAVSLQDGTGALLLRAARDYPATGAGGRRA